MPAGARGDSGPAAAAAGAPLPPSARRAPCTHCARPTSAPAGRLTVCIYPDGPIWVQGSAAGPCLAPPSVVASLLRGLGGGILGPGLPPGLGRRRCLGGLLHHVCSLHLGQGQTPECGLAAGSGLEVRCHCAYGFGCRRYQANASNTPRFGEGRAPSGHAASPCAVGSICSGQALCSLQAPLQQSPRPAAVDRLHRPLVQPPPRLRVLSLQPGETHLSLRVRRAASSPCVRPPTLAAAAPAWRWRP